VEVEAGEALSDVVVVSASAEVEVAGADVDEAKPPPLEATHAQTAAAELATTAAPGPHEEMTQPIAEAWIAAEEALEHWQA